MDMEKLLSEAMKLQQNLTDTQEELEEKEFESSVGGGIIRVRMKGTMEIQEIVIDDEMLKLENKEDLQELLANCINQNIEKIKKEKDKQMKSMTAGISIPGVF